MPYSGPACTERVRSRLDRIVGWLFRCPDLDHYCGRRRRLTHTGPWGWRCKEHLHVD